MENIFDCLCTALAEPEMKTAFLESEGVELMIIMMQCVLRRNPDGCTDMSCRQKLLAKTRAIKVLDYALQSEDGSASCERFVEMLGLKSFFSTFMGKVGIYLSFNHI
jgi:beta-catenin-like protein 1